MEEIMRESGRLKRALEGLADSIEQLREACEHIGAEGAADCAEEACGKVNEAARLMGDIDFELGA